MLNARFTPIKGWPGNPTASYKRKRSPFKAGWQKTLDLLETELSHLRAADVSIEGYFAPKDIRNDGWPKSSARPTQPGVILSFATKQGSFSYPCDHYADWEANLRAIALTLTDLRSIQRHGVATEKGEQYTGWLKLPPASAADEALQLAEILCRFAAVDASKAKLVAASVVDFAAVWREAVRRTHPDTGGKAEEFNAVIAARDRLKEMRGW